MGLIKLDQIELEIEFCLRVTGRGCVALGGGKDRAEKKFADGRLASAEV